MTIKELIVFEGKLAGESQDGGLAMLCEFIDESDNDPFFVRLQSWDQTRQHTTLTRFLASRKVRVTVEIIE